jgi:hypothetical protein
MPLDLDRDVAEVDVVESGAAGVDGARLTHLWLARPTEEPA